MNYIKLGQAISRAKVSRCGDNDYPVLSITMKDGIVMQSDKFKKRIASKDISEYKVIPAGMLVQGIHMDEGNFGIQDIVPYGIVSPAYTVWTVDESVVFPKYIEMVLRSPRCIDYYRSKLNGTVNRRGHMSEGDFLGMQIPCPSIEEQKHVVTTMNQVKQVMISLSEEMTALDQLIKARFVEIFGDSAKRRRLEDYTELITKGASPKWQGVDYTNEGTLFVTSENVREGYVDLSKRKYLPDTINEIQPRSVLHRNDVLINIVGASIGRAAIFNSNELANINQAVALVRLKEKAINLRFLITFLNSQEAQRSYGLMKKGGARDNLSLKNISDLMIPIAAISEQERFATFVSQVDKSKLSIQASLDQLETLKQSLMQKYFG